MNKKKKCKTVWIIVLLTILCVSIDGDFLNNDVTLKLVALFLDDSVIGNVFDLNKLRDGLVF